MAKHRRTSGMKDALSEMFGAPAEPKILTAAEASAMVANVEKCMCSNSPAQVADEYEESQAMSWAE